MLMRLVDPSGVGSSDSWDWEWKGASSGVGVMLVSDTALWLEKGGTIGRRYERFWSQT